MLIKSSLIGLFILVFTLDRGAESFTLQDDEDGLSGGLYNDGYFNDYGASGDSENYPGSYQDGKYRFNDGPLPPPTREAPVEPASDQASSNSNCLGLREVTTNHLRGLNASGLATSEFFVPSCDENGDYTPKQCKYGKSPQCWCVNKKGQERFGTRLNLDPTKPHPKCPERLTTRISAKERASSLCMKQQRNVLEERRRGNLDNWVPLCDVRGNFETLQCKDKEYCFCVDDWGRPFSRSFSYAEALRRQCNNTSVKPEPRPRPNPVTRPPPSPPIRPRWSTRPVVNKFTTTTTTTTGRSESAYNAPPSPLTKTSLHQPARLPKPGQRPTPTIGNRSTVPSADSTNSDITFDYKACPNGAADCSGSAAASSNAASINNEYRIVSEGNGDGGLSSDPASWPLPSLKTSVPPSPLLQKSTTSERPSSTTTERRLAPTPPFPGPRITATSSPRSTTFSTFSPKVPSSTTSQLSVVGRKQTDQQSMGEPNDLATRSTPAPGPTTALVTASAAVDSQLNDGSQGNNLFSNLAKNPGLLAGVVGGAVVGLLLTILLVMFLVYRLRKKDEGSYSLEEPAKKQPFLAYAAREQEFYA